MTNLTLCFFKRLLEATQRVTEARKKHAKSRKACQTWLAEASRRLVACKAAAAASAVDQPHSNFITLEQKLFHLRTRRQAIQVFCWLN